MTAAGNLNWAPLSSNNSNAADAPSLIAASSSNGFTLAGNKTDTNAGTPGSDYVCWNFKAAPKFFDIQTYTGTGSAQNISHDLASKPGMIIVKRTETTQNWCVYHQSLTATKALALNTTEAEKASAVFFNDTEPTDTDFTVGTTNSNNLGEYVAYLFADEPGLIKCGSYTGTAGAQTINCGFEAGWVMVKCSSVAADWVICDNTRGDYVQLYPNVVNTEETKTDGISFGNSNGFDIDTASPMTNGAGQTFVYVAIAAPVVRNLTQEEVNATKLLFQTKPYRQEKYAQDLAARGAALRSDLEAQGFTTAEIDEVLDETSSGY